MSRCCLLPMPGDPFILANFISNFDRVWSDEVDMLYVFLNIDCRMPQEIIDWDIAFLTNRPKVKFIFENNMLFQGAALRRLLPEVKEDLIMSIEDDTVIFKKGQVDACFRKIETGRADVVGSPRMCLSPQLAEACKNRYGLDYTGYGDKGPVYWPNFFFCRKSDLLKTDLHFEPKGWEKGEYIKELDITAEDTLAGDVFVWLCIQLRAMGLVFYDVPQYHSHPEDLNDIRDGRNLGDTQCPWIHIGSLTMTAEDLLMGVHLPENHKNTPKSDMEKKELERRYAWIMLFVEKNPRVSKELAGVAEKYVQRINRFISVFNLSISNIYALKKAYTNFLLW